MSFFIHRLIAEVVADAPSVSAMDRGFQLGDGVFDTMVAFEGRAFGLERHLARLQAHAAVIGIDAGGVPVRETVETVLAETGARHAIIRTTLTRGQAARGLWPAAATRPSLLVTAQPWSAGLVGQPARLCHAGTPRNQRSPLSRIKSLAYLDNILAARQAAEAGADDALICNLDGDAVCTTIANVFAIVRGELFTPPLADGCLDGVMRALVLEEAARMGLRCNEQSLGPAVLAEADGIFLSNSVRVIRPVSELAGRQFPVLPLISQILARLLVRIERETSACLAPPASVS